VPNAEWVSNGFHILQENAVFSRFHKKDCATMLFMLKSLVVYYTEYNNFNIVTWMIGSWSPNPLSQKRRRRKRRRRRSQNDLNMRDPLKSRDPGTSPTVYRTAAPLKIKCLFVITLHDWLKKMNFHPLLHPRLRLFSFPISLSKCFIYFSF
jgi:hypothetical protein